MFFFHDIISRYRHCNFIYWICGRIMVNENDYMIAYKATDFIYNLVFCSSQLKMLWQFLLLYYSIFSSFSLASIKWKLSDVCALNQQVFHFTWMLCIFFCNINTFFTFTSSSIIPYSTPGELIISLFNKRSVSDRTFEPFKWIVIEQRFYKLNETYLRIFFYSKEHS